MATPTLTVSEGPMNYYMEQTPHLGASQVPNYEKGPWIHPESAKDDLLWEGFGHSLHIAASKLKKLREPKVAKFKGGYSSNTSFMFQLWLKDIWMYVLEHPLSQWEAIQLVKEYTSKHV